MPNVYDQFDTKAAPNPYDQFDAATTANVYDQFDAAPTRSLLTRAKSAIESGARTAASDVADVNDWLNRAVAPVSREINTILAPLRKGNVSPSALPPGREPAQAPSQVDQAAAFAQREALAAKLQAAGKDPTRDLRWQALTRAIARTQTSRASQAALFAVPTAEGIAGGLARTLRRGGREGAVVSAAAAGKAAEAPAPATRAATPPASETAPGAAAVAPARLNASGSVGAPEAEWVQPPGAFGPTSAAHVNGMAVRPFDLSLDELDTAIAEKSMSDHAKLVKALGSEEAAEEFDRLDRARNGSNPERADAAEAKFEAKFGNLTPEQERLVYGIGDLDAPVDDLKALRQAREPLEREADQEVARVLTRGMLDADPQEIAATFRGEATPASAQIAAARIQTALGEMARRGMTAPQINAATSAAMSARGYSPDDAMEVLSAFRGQFGRETPNVPAAQLPAPRRPEDLLEFLARSGGIRDSGGELRALDAHRKFVPGAGMLVRKTGGKNLDAAREAAEEVGYLRPGSTVNDLLDAIDKNLRGRHVFSDRDETAALDWQDHQARMRAADRAASTGEPDLDELRRRATSLGIEVRPDATPDEILADVHEREGMMAEGAAQDTHADQLARERAATMRAHLPEAVDELPFDDGHEAGQAGASAAGTRSAAAAGARSEAFAREAQGGTSSRALSGGGGEAPPGGRGPPGTGGIGGRPPGTPRQPALPLPPTPRRGVLRTLMDPVQRLFSPTTMSRESLQQEALMREVLGEAERATQAARAELEQYRRRVATLPPARQLDFLGYVEGRSNGAQLRDPVLRPMADSLRSIFDERRKQIETLPSTERASFVDDYFPHAWTDPTAARQVMQDLRMAGGRQGSGTNLKKRSIPTIADGIAAGLTPRTTDPVAAATAYVVNMDRFLAINRIFDTMKENGTARFFAPGDAPDGWMQLKGRLAEKAAPTGDGGAMVLHAYAPADAARVFNNFVGRGFYDDFAGGAVGPLYDVAQRGMNAITMAELSFSAFHAAAMAQEAVISGVARSIGQMARGEIVKGVASLAKAPIEPVLGYLRGAKFANVYLRNFDADPDFNRVVMLGTRANMRAVGRGREYLGSTGGSFIKRGAVKHYFEAWRRGELELEARAAGARVAQGFRATANEIREQPVMGTIRALARNMARLMDTTAAPLFDDIIPKLKNGAFYSTMRDWIEAHPTAVPEEQLAAARRIWDSIDNRFGELVMDDLFWARTLKQSLQLFTRSVGWDLGTLREIGGGVIDVARGQVYGRNMSPRAKYVIALPIVTGVINGALTYLKTGRAPQSIADLYAYRTGGTNPDDSPERAMLPGYMRDVLGYIHDTPGEIWGKAATGVHLIYELMTNRDYRGLPIGDPNAGIWTAAGRARLPSFIGAYVQHVAEAFEPIQFQTRLRAGSHISLPERMLAVRPAPFYIQNPERLRAIEQKRGNELMREKMKADRRLQLEQVPE